MKIIALILLSVSLSLQAMEEEASEPKTIGIMNIMPDGRLVLFSYGSDSIESPNFFELLGKPFPEPSDFDLRAGLEPIFRHCEEVLRKGKGKLPEDVLKQAECAIGKVKTKLKALNKVALPKEPYYEDTSVWVPKEETEKNPVNLEEDLCSRFGTNKGYYSGYDESQCPAYMELVDHAAAMAGLAQNGPIHKPEIDHPLLYVIASSVGERAKTKKDHNPERIHAVGKSLQNLLDNFNYCKMAKKILDRHFKAIEMPVTSLRSLLVIVAQNNEKFTSIDRVENRYVFETASHRNEIIIQQSEAYLADYEYRAIAISKILAHFFDCAAIYSLNASNTFGLARYLVRCALSEKEQWAWEDRVLTRTSMNSTYFYYFPEKIIRTIENLRLDEEVIAQLIALLGPYKV